MRLIVKRSQERAPANNKITLLNSRDTAIPTTTASKLGDNVKGIKQPEEIFKSMVEQKEKVLT